MLSLHGTLGSFNHLELQALMLQMETSVKGEADHSRKRRVGPSRNPLIAFCPSSELITLSE